MTVVIIKIWKLNIFKIIENDIRLGPTLMKIFAILNQTLLLGIWGKYVCHP